MTNTRLKKFVETFKWIRANEIPFTKLNKPIAKCKVAIVTTGGVYENADIAFNIVNREDVDEGFREIKSTTEYTDLSIAHEHFNKQFSAVDLNVIFPVQRLKELVKQGFINKVSEVNFSITGFVPEPNHLFNTGKQIAQRINELGVDITLIVPVWPICQQSGGLVARAIEKSGVPTVTFNLIKQIVSIIGIPRAINVKNPFGCTIGQPNNVELQQQVIKEALHFVNTATQPAEIKIL